MDDVRAVLDAVGSKRAALLGIADGAPMSLLFAATYPDRCFALVLYKCWARWSWAPDYPWAPTREQLDRDIRSMEVAWGSDESARRAATALWPTRVDDALIAALARLNRQSASPGGAAALERMNADIDVRDVLPSIRVPALVLDRPASIEPSEASSASRRVANKPHVSYVAEHIPGARYHLLPGVGEGLFGNEDDVYSVVREFLE